MRFVCRKTKATTQIQTHTQDIQYFLISHGNNGYVKAPVLRCTDVAGLDVCKDQIPAG